ncbi:hypothetical protein GCM10010341_61210 [Streptomyces noursei]|nr:hypothetical protein GCM10010341_61210 [Streptomyces noursei]
MSRPAKSSTAGKAGVVLSGSRKSRGDDADCGDEEARRFDFWGLRDMQCSAFLETAQTGVRTMTVRTPVSGYASGNQAGMMFSACGPFWPCVTSKETRWPSWSSRKPWD